MRRDDPLIPHLVSCEEAGRMLGMTKQGVSAMIRRGDLPARLVGRNYVIRAAVVAGIADPDQKIHTDRW